METKNNAFWRKLLETFRVEAAEHVRAMSSGLIALEKAVEPEKRTEIAETIFREVHSLKGAARAVNKTEIGTICHSLETAFAALKRQNVTLTPELFDTLHRDVDALARLLVSSQPEHGSQQGLQTSKTIRSPEGAEEVLSPAEVTKKGGGETGPSPSFRAVQPSTFEKPAVSDTIRISAAKLDSLFLETEELLSVKLAMAQRAAELREILADLAARRKRWPQTGFEAPGMQRPGRGENGLPGLGKAAKEFAKWHELFEQDSALMKSVQGRLASTAARAEHDARLLAGKLGRLLDDLKRALMLPFSSILEVFPKFVRDFSREEGKEVDLVIRGGEIEIDKRILEEMKDPLVHLIRNCVDHGIERPEERAARKKPRQGTLTIVISQKSGDKVEMVVSDDGAGIAVEKVRAAAVKMSVVSVSEAEKLGEREVTSLVFHSGVSTKLILTDISGRGLGLAIVREKVEKVGGEVSVDSLPGQGTTFRMVLPITLATFRGILVRAGEQFFVFPTASVERVARTEQAGIQTVENRETVQLGGQAVSLARLEDALELPRQTVARDSGVAIPLVVLRSAEKRMAFAVDEILNEQEVLVKSLGRQLANAPNLAGATVLGTGKVALILSVADLMKSAVRAGAVPVRAGVGAEEAPARQKSILVAEDSITARSLLKGILETAGYRVRTAVDGVDALTALKTEEFDLVVSDVDMPRMNGFGLTAKIRADKKFSELPVVLVTALESREDRERGIDAGASAYIVKSSFDQSNLLEIVQRLI